MDEDQKPDPSLIGLEIACAASKRTPSFGDWMKDRTNLQHQITVKHEPLSPPTQQKSYLQALESAIKDWVPTKPPNNKFQTHGQLPAAMVPFSPPKQVKVSGQPSGIPKKPRSDLKRKAIGSQPNESPASSKKSVDKLVCEICEISCSGPLSMQQHLKGRPHKAKLEYMRSSKGKPRCNICGIWCSDWAGMEMHFKGHKHKAKLQEMELCKNNGGLKMSKSPVMCQLCLVPCMNQDLYKMHLKGRQHTTKQELKRRGML